MIRLFDEIPPEHFGALLKEYQRFFRAVLEEAGGHEIEVVFDSVTAAFQSAKQAALAAAAAQRAVATRRVLGGELVRVAAAFELPFRHLCPRCALGVA